MSMNFVENAISDFVSDFADNSQRKLGSKSLFANEKGSRMPEFLTFSEKEPQKRWQKTISSSAKSNSTLSLHLAAYEDDAHEIEKEQNCTPKFSKALPSFCDSLEFPRQQDDQVGEPEVMQFKSSQKVLNPNEASSAKSINKKSSGGNPSEKGGRKAKDGKENRVAVRRGTSPTYLEVQTNASETGFKTVRTDRGSYRETSRTVQSPEMQAQSPRSPLRTGISPLPPTARSPLPPTALSPHPPTAVSPSPPTAASPIPITAKRAQTARTIVVMRHGERLDDLFGEWYEYCKNKNGVYRQRDLNMPPDLSPLNRVLHEYENDTALTVLGHVLAQKIGRAMLVSGRSPDMVYCSPALRCIQTASVAATMTGESFKLRIEPGLFENFDLYPTKKPKFVTVEELKKSGFNIDDDYTPYIKLEDLFSVPETNEMYNDRVQSTLQYIVNKSAPGRGTVLVAAHASTVDLGFGKFHSRFLAKPRRTTSNNLVNIATPIPYSSNVTFMRNSDDEPWQYIREALPPITYRNFSNRLDHEFIERNHTVQ